MIITFCGHADFTKGKEYEKRILEILEQEVGDKLAQMYLGGYGNFDEFAYSCCKIYKESHPNISLILVTPYMTPEYQKNRLSYEKEKYDEIIYPEIEDKALKFAISYRNKYMVKCADVVIAFIEREFGGAYQTYKYAKGKCKVYNLAQK